VRHYGFDFLKVAAEDLKVQLSDSAQMARKSCIVRIPLNIPAGKQLLLYPEQVYAVAHAAEEVAEGRIEVLTSLPSVPSRRLAVPVSNADGELIFARGEDQMLSNCSDSASRGMLGVQAVAQLQGLGENPVADLDVHVVYIPLQLKNCEAALRL
jgi:hypothetical protein